MSKTQSTSFIFVVVMALAGAALIPIAVSSRSVHAVREIRLVARSMTYYLEGSTVPNPTLLVRRGEQVRIVLRNGDPGMVHDFGIDAWSVRTRLVDDKGKEDGVIEFKAPERPVDAAYSCTPHTQMMRGTIRVE
jgi:hypothetical protein